MVQALRRIIEQEKPDYIVPEIEAIATETLLELEQEGHPCHSNSSRRVADDGPRRHSPLGCRDV